MKHAGNLYPSQPLKRTTNGLDNVDATDFSNQKSRISSEMFIESLSTYKSINSNMFLQKGNSFILRAKGEDSADQISDGNYNKNVNTYEREDGSLIDVALINLSPFFPLANKWVTLLSIHLSSNKNGVVLLVVFWRAHNLFYYQIFQEKQYLFS